MVPRSLFRPLSVTRKGAVFCWQQPPLSAILLLFGGTVMFIKLAMILVFFAITIAVGILSARSAKGYK